MPPDRRRPEPRGPAVAAKDLSAAGTSDAQALPATASQPALRATRLFECRGGSLALPAADLVLADAADGGNLIVDPPREVWERSELSPPELTAWGFLVAAAGRAMLDVLPQLEGGCVNYWDAGNWALNAEAEPRGPKTGPLHRHLHLHLLGRSRAAKSPDWRWGEAPRFPDFGDRHAWAKPHRRLGAAECERIVTRTEHLLRSRYGWVGAELGAWSPCPICRYPTPSAAGQPCSPCRPA